MPDGSDRIDWKSLTHADGTAEDLPELLRDLLSDDEGVREEARNDGHDFLRRRL
jgi:hypothetical protein